MNLNDNALQAAQEADTRWIERRDRELRQEIERACSFFAQSMKVPYTEVRSTFLFRADLGTTIARSLVGTDDVFAIIFVEGDEAQSQFAVLRSGETDASIRKYVYDFAPLRTCVVCEKLYLWSRFRGLVEYGRLLKEMGNEPFVCVSCRDARRED